MAQSIDSESAAARRVNRAAPSVAKLDVALTHIAQ